MKSLVDKELLDEAEKRVKESGLVIETPMLGDVAAVFDGLIPSNISLYLKLENMQTNGWYLFLKLELNKIIKELFY